MSVPPSSSDHALTRLIGMVRSPRATLGAAIAHRRSLDLAVLIVSIAAASSVGFLLTRVGELAALDQQVRQLESFGVAVTDGMYADLRRLAPYRPLVAAVSIAVGWPFAWLAGAGLIHALGNRFAGRSATFAQVLAIVVHASAVLAVRAVVAAPLNYARESLGGATSASLLLPSFAESSFPARLAGAVDLFVLWWIALVAIGLGMLYATRPVVIGRWLFGAYAAGAAALALTQAIRGGI